MLRQWHLAVVQVARLWWVGALDGQLHQAGVYWRERESARGAGAEWDSRQRRLTEAASVH